MKPGWAHIDPFGFGPAICLPSAYPSNRAAKTRHTRKKISGNPHPLVPTRIFRCVS